MAKKTRRDEEIGRRPAIRKKLLDIFKDVDQGYADQRQRSDDIMDYWDMYNCRLGDRQFYAGNAKVYVPIVKNAVRARRTRFTNQLFPQSGRYVDVTTENQDIPHATTALLDHYVRASKLRTQVVPSLIVNGDCEGQYTVYVGWRDHTKHTVYRVRKPVKVDGLEYEELGHTEDIKEEEVDDARPYVEVVPDADLLVLPQTSDSIAEALDNGGSVTVIRRWTKARLKQMAADGEIDEKAADEIYEEMKGTKPEQPDTRKDQAKAAGIRTQGGSKFVLGYETWTKLKVEGEMRICRAYFAGGNTVLGCKLNPYWCDEVPVISTPVEKVTGVFKGRAPAADVIDTQVLANDAVNEGADTQHFSAMPIIMTDPEKNPKIGTMVLGLASVWETNPNDTQFAKFPELWKSCFEMVANCKNEIFQTLGVNPAMIPQSTGGKAKRNQAEIANEQQVDILTTADFVTTLEEGIMTPLLARFAAYDQQFREDPVIVRQFGEMGLRATMEQIDPIAYSNRYEFRWFGVEAARNAAQMQQQIAAANVMKGIPPQMYPGYQLNMAPLMTQLAENVFGPRLAPLIFRDMKQQLAVDPMLENEILQQGMDVDVHAMDDDPKHLQAHMALMSQTQDPTGNIRAHVMKHQQQMQMKQQAQAQAAQAKGMPGSPGGAGKGVAGQPAEGAQPGQTRQQGPNGMINPDRMAAAGAPVMPRKM